MKFFPSMVNCQWSIVKRLSLVIFFLISYFLLTSSFIFNPSSFGSVHAAIPCPTTSSAGEINNINKTAITGGYDDKIFNLNQIIGTTDSLYTMLAGCSIAHPYTNSATAGRGALAASGNLVAFLYSAPPVSGIQYFANKIQDLNPVKPAYAQSGIGFQVLSPVQGAWEKFRNAAYAGFVIVFVIIGFMIMFRAHISPQAVATVQDTLPRLVIALILVTFSYAIAGLMIDLMFLILNIAIQLLGLSARANVIFDRSIIGVITSGWGEVFLTVSNSIDALIKDIVSANALGLITGLFVGAMAGTVAGLIIGIAILFIMFRIFFMLLQAYAMIIILTIFAPFFFLFQALPGQNGARAWFIQMGSHVLTFAVVGIMILLAGYVGGIEAFGSTTPGVPLGGGTTGAGAQSLKFPLLSGGLGSIGGLIALGFLMMTPEAANLVRNFMNVRTPGFGGAGVAAAGAAGGWLGARARGVASPFTGAVGDIAAYRGFRARERIIESVPGALRGGRTQEIVRVPVGSKPDPRH